MDLEKESTIQVDTGKAKDIALQCNKLLEIQREIVDLENQLKLKKELERKFSEETIPNLMHEAGITLMKLADGGLVEIKTKYYARIPSSRTDEAYDWLRSNGYEDLIKNEVNMSFGMKEDNLARSVVEELKEKGLNVAQKTSVHHSTLAGWVKEQITDGKDVPNDLFGVYVANRSHITTNK